MARKIDWEPIERDYRTGRMSLGELAIKYGGDRSNILRHMQKAGIRKDLSEQVRVAAKAELITRLAAEQQKGDYGAVVSAGNVVANVVEDQVGLLAKMRRESHAMMDEVAAAREVSRRVDAARVLELARACELDVGDVRTMLSAVSMQSRASVARVAVDMASRVIPLERKALGMDEESGDKGFESVKALTDELRREREASK